MAGKFVSANKQNSLRPFIPVITSTGGGGKTIFFSCIAPHQDCVDTNLNLSNSPCSEGGGDLSLELGCGVVGDKGAGVGEGRTPSLDDDQTLELSTISVDNGDDDARSSCSEPRVYNPMPLNCYMEEGGEVCTLGFVRKIRNRRTRGDGDDEEFAPPSIEEYPEVMQAIETMNGSRPVFLYSKKLENTDVSSNLSRLLLTNRDPVFEFLNAAEVEAVDRTSLGLQNIVGVDQRGKKFDLGLRKWLSFIELKTVVINSNWYKLAAANNAEKDDLVHIWGFRRRNTSLGLAVVFRKK